MATEWLGDAFDDAAGVASTREQRPVITTENVAMYGSAHDITRITLGLKDDKKLQAALGMRLAGAATEPGTAWKLISYIAALMTLEWPRDENTREEQIHALIANAAVLLLDNQKTGLDGTLDDITACIRSDMKQPLRDRMLRVAADDGHINVVHALIAAGANTQAYGSRALFNAVMEDKIDCARLLRAHGADIQAARQTARDLGLDSAKIKRLGLQLIKLAISGELPDDYYHAAIENTPNGYPDRAPLRDKALALFKADKPEPLQQFLRGYLSIKRDQERSRNSDPGYDANVVVPLLSILESADQPQQALARALHALPLRDRQTATHLLLRHICDKGMSPLIADAVIVNGGDVGIFGNMPLSLAIRGGHSDLALHLIRRHGANIGEAVLDAQINNMTGSGLQKLYAFIATHVVQNTPQRIILAKKPILPTSP